MYLNRITLVGFLGDKPDIRTAGGDGKKVAAFRVATSTTWKDKAGNEQSETQWHQVEVWGGWVDSVAKLEKGAKVYVEGEMKYREWDKPDGSKGYGASVTARVVVEMVHVKQSDRR